jgi:hypothetical protein
MLETQKIYFNLSNLITIAGSLQLIYIVIFFNNQSHTDFVLKTEIYFTNSVVASTD